MGGVRTDRGVFRVGLGLANPTRAVLGRPRFKVQRLGDRRSVEVVVLAAAGEAFGLRSDKNLVGVIIGVTRPISWDRLLFALAAILRWDGDMFT